MSRFNDSRVIIDQLRLGGLEASIFATIAYQDEHNGLWITEHVLDIYREQDHTILHPHQFRLGDLPIIEKLTAWAYEQILSYHDDCP